MPDGADFKDLQRRMDGADDMFSGELIRLANVDQHSCVLLQPARNLGGGQGGQDAHGDHAFSEETGGQ